MSSCECPLFRRRSAASLVHAASMLAVLAFAGCATKPLPPTEISGVVQAARNMNPSVSKRPSPLVVRVYELKTAAAFNSADFVSLYQRDQAELGADLVAREEMILNPGDSKPFAKIAAPETRFIGVFGAYRNVDRAKWRSIVAVQPNQKQRIMINADELAISVTVSK